MINKFHKLVAYIVLFSVGTYLVARPFLLFLFVTIGIVFIFVHKFLPKVNYNNLAKPAIGILFIGGLAYSFLYSREFTHDALILYYKNMLMLADHWKITYTVNPPWPYLGELVFTIILKLSSLRFVSLFIYSCGLAALILTYKLIIKLFNNKNLAALTTLILAASPSFVFLTINELKIDVFLFVVSLTSFHFLVDYITTKKANKAFIAILLSSLCVLIKVSYLPIALTLLGFCGLEFINNYRNQKAVVMLLRNSILAITTFIFPFMLWLAIFGDFTFIKTGIYTPTSNINRILLTRDLKQENQCYNFDLESDYSEYTNTKNPLIRYVEYIVFGIKNRFEYEKSNIGILMFIGMYLGFLLPLLHRELFKNKALVYLYASSIIYTVSYMAWVRVIAWYVMPYYPFYALYISYFILNTGISTRFRQLLKYMAILVCITYFILIYITSAFFLLVAPYKDTGYSREELYKLNMRINELHGKDGSYFLNASTRARAVFLTYVKNSDAFVVPAGYYFLNELTTEAEKYAELKSKNINYIITDKAELYSPIYAGCVLRRNTKLLDFINKYTEPVIDDKVFKLK